MKTYQEILDITTSLEQEFMGLREDARRRYELYTLRLEPAIDPNIAREEQVNILSPMVIWAAHTIRSDLLMNPTEFMVIPLARESNGRIPRDDEKRADNLEKALAVVWSKLDDNRRIDFETIWHQLVSPFGVIILECVERELPDQPDEMKDEVYADLIERIQRESMPWSLFVPDPMTCAWRERSGKPTVFVRRFKQLIQDVERNYSRRPRSDFYDHDLRFEDGVWVWKRISEDYEPTAFHYSTGFKECEMVWLADDTHVYHIAMNGGGGGQVVWQGPNPFGRVPAFIVPGNITPFRNPQDRYEPFLWPLMQTIDQINVIRTTRATASRNVSGPKNYIPLTPEIIKTYETMGKKLPAGITFKSQSIPYTLGKVEEVPAHVDPDMDKLEFNLTQDLQKYLPSPFLNVLDPAVLKSATASAILHAAESNMRMYGPLMSLYDGVKKEICESLIYYTIGQDDKVYAYALGDEIARGKNIKQGSVFELSKKAVDFPSRLHVRTRSMSQAQAAAQYEHVLSQWILPDGSKGPAAYEDLIDAANYSDKAAQLEKIAAEGLLGAITGSIKQMALAAFYARMKARTGMDLPLGDESARNQPARLTNAAQRLDAPLTAGPTGGTESTL